MDSAAMLRSFQYCVGTGSSNGSLVDSLAVRSTVWSPSSTLCIPGSGIVGKVSCSSIKQRASPIYCVKAAETAVVEKANAEDAAKGTAVVKTLQNTTFPKGFETLISEICDDTEIAEVKLRIGSFEMHLKRNVGARKSAEAIVSPTVAPPIPSEPMIESLPATPSPSPSPPKPPAEKSGFFKNTSLEKSPKLQALEASGSAGYVLVTSPTVGSFRRARTFKGKKQPPSCKEGDMIKEGQTIGFLDQFGTELPVKSDVAGEVLKVLVSDGEPVGYGDPLIAVLPSFHGIR